MAIYQLGDWFPRFDASAYVHETAAVTSFVGWRSTAKSMSGAVCITPPP
jgi:hypothetical protein